MQMETTLERIALPGTPRIERRGPLLIAGVITSFNASVPGQFGAPWQRFIPDLDKVWGQPGQFTYGVCVGCSGADTFEYLCGVEVTDWSAVPQDWSRLRIPAQTYAVFAHRGDVTNLREVIRMIFEEWLPNSGHEPASTAEDVPDLFERYGFGFDAQAGGDMEVWLAINASGRTLAAPLAGNGP